MPITSLKLFLYYIILRNPKIPETGFLREFTHPHRDLRRNPVSDSPQTNSKNSKKPGFCENLPILTEILRETRFLTPHRQTPKIPETGFLRSFTHPHRDIARNPVSDSPQTNSKNPRNRVSAIIYPSSPRFSEKTRFLTPHRQTPKIPETGFLRSFTHPHRDFAQKPGF